jgi:hypothetical protein
LKLVSVLHQKGLSWKPFKIHTTADSMDALLRVHSFILQKFMEREKHWTMQSDLKNSWMKFCVFSPVALRMLERNNVFIFRFFLKAMWSKSWKQNLIRKWKAHEKFSKSKRKINLNYKRASDLKRKLNIFGAF